MMARKQSWPARKKKFDLLLLDIQMPVMSGIAALKWIKTLENGNEGAPAFALTAHSHNAEIKVILSKGFEAVLQKPFRVSEMMRHLGRPYKNNVERDTQQEGPEDTDPKIYSDVMEMPLLEVRTLDILLGAIAPRVCAAFESLLEGRRENARLAQGHANQFSI